MEKIVFISLHIALLFTTLSFSYGVKSENSVLDEKKILIEWESETVNGAQISLEIEKLYKVLYNTKALHTYKFFDPPNLQIVEILRREKLYFGDHFSVDVDSILCDLNPHVCKRDLIDVSPEKLTDITSHIGGYEPSKGQWRNSAFTKYLILPKLAFDTFADIQKLEVSPKSARDFINVSDQDCEQRWGYTCKEIYELINPHLTNSNAEDEKLYRASIPVLGLRSQLRFELEGLDKFTITKISKNQIVEDNSDNSQLEFPTEFSETWEKKTQELPLLETRLRKLSRNISLISDIRTKSTHKKNKSQEDNSLHEFISHPYMLIGEYPDSLRSPVNIGIIDFFVDSQHCEFKESIHLFPNNYQQSTKSPRSSTKQCGKYAGDTNYIFDHGTHVTGIIASKPNEVGIVGLNPFAKVNYIPIEQSQLRSNPNYQTNLANNWFMSSLDRHIKVYNVSWEYERINSNLKRDKITDAINYLEHIALVVTAAGNTLKEYESDCDILPTCLGKNINVISVVGLNKKKDDFEIWKSTSDPSIGSNTGKVFHIAAVAENVLSTSSGNHVGYLSGTSQAAPQVTAAASLIYSKYISSFTPIKKDLYPLDVKNRLIYSSDISTKHLYHLFGGKLNIERALDFENDIVVIDVDGIRREYIGRITKFGNFKENTDEYITCENSNGMKSNIKKRNLKRMFYNEDTKRYVVYYQSQEMDSPLNRDTNCFLTTRSHIVEFETSNGLEVTFKFRDIKDYVAKML